MTTFNKILNPMYSTIASYSTQDDGSISAKYVIGTGEDNDGSVTSFTPVIAEYKYIATDDAQSIMTSPLTQDDIGKTPTEIVQERIYTFLKEKGEIVI